MEHRKGQIGDVKEFSFTEMVSNSSGKTSASGVMGVYLCVIGGLTFLVGAISLVLKGTSSDIMVQSIALSYAGALLLGFRKSADKSEYVNSMNVPIEPLLHEHEEPPLIN